MVTVRKSKLLDVESNTYYFEFDVDTIAELPERIYNGANVAHGSLATIIANGRQYRINGEGEWCIQRYDASDPILIEKTITENGTYTALDEDVDGYSSVIANVPNTYTAGDEGKVVDNGALVAQTARAESITANGTYDTTTNNSVTVDVANENNAKFKLTDNFGSGALEYVDVPNGVITLVDYAFYNISNLKRIDFPSTLTTIGSNAFRDCIGLTSIEIPSSVTSIATSAFVGCSYLARIVVHKAENSIPNAPWGATNATVIWDG